MMKFFIIKPVFIRYGNINEFAHHSQFFVEKKSKSFINFWRPNVKTIFTHSLTWYPFRRQRSPEFRFMKRSVSQKSISQENFEHLWAIFEEENPPLTWASWLSSAGHGMRRWDWGCDARFGPTRHASRPGRRSLAVSPTAFSLIVPGLCPAFAWRNNDSPWCTRCRTGSDTCMAQTSKHTWWAVLPLLSPRWRLSAKRIEEKHDSDQSNNRLLKQERRNH